MAAASSVHGTVRRSASPTAVRVRGPTVYDQPAYEVRRTDAGGWEARRRAG